MYVLLKIGIFQPAMLVYQSRGYIPSNSQCYFLSNFRTFGEAANMLLCHHEPMIPLGVFRYPKAMGVDVTVTKMYLYIYIYYIYT